MSTLEGDLRTEADAPLGFDPDSFQGIVADAVTLRLDEHNGAVTLSADLVGELGDLVDEWVEEVEKLEAAEANLDSAIAAYNAADTIDKETLRDGVIEAQDALDAARREYTRRETEILAKLADIIERMGGIGGDDDGKDKKSERDWRKEQDEDGTPGSPEKPVSPRSTPESPGASESPGGDTEPSVTPAPGSTDLSTAATPTTQQS
ncbi:MAG: hypothetical protein KDB26_05250, partial [Microthrixaceae bacterium]|nr:hypothetical protein [Microthrixaceae bacterium]